MNCTYLDVTTISLIDKDTFNITNIKPQNGIIVASATDADGPVRRSNRENKELTNRFIDYVKE